MGWAKRVCHIKCGKYIQDASKHSSLFLHMAHCDACTNLQFQQWRTFAVSWGEGASSTHLLIWMFLFFFVVFFLFSFILEDRVIQDTRKEDSWTLFDEKDRKKNKTRHGQSMFPWEVQCNFRSLAQWQHTSTVDQLFLAKCIRWQTCNGQYP